MGVGMRRTSGVSALDARAAPASVRSRSGTSTVSPVCSGAFSTICPPLASPKRRSRRRGSHVDGPDAELVTAQPAIDCSSAAEALHWDWASPSAAASAPSGAPVSARTAASPSQNRSGAVRKSTSSVARCVERERLAQGVVDLRGHRGRDAAPRVDAVAEAVGRAGRLSRDHGLQHLRRRDRTAAPSGRRRSSRRWGGPRRGSRRGPGCPHPRPPARRTVAGARASRAGRPRRRRGRAGVALSADRLDAMERPDGHAAPPRPAPAGRTRRSRWSGSRATAWRRPGRSPRGRSPAAAEGCA